MGSMKLLDKPLKAFIIYTVILLLFSIPLYVIAIDHILTYELDENNRILLKQSKYNMETIFDSDHINKSIKDWNVSHPSVMLKKVHSNEVSIDYAYDVYRQNIFDDDNEMEQFRGLISYYKYKNHWIEIKIEPDIEKADSLIPLITITTFIFVLLIIIGFIFLNRKISTQIWKPFYTILDKLKSYDLKSHQSIELPKSDIQEFENLRNSIEKLVLKNRRTFESQKSFVENASHELQTPLALIRSKIDLYMQNKDLDSITLTFLNDISGPIAKLSRINKNLLVLSKVENRNFDRKSTLDLIHIIQESIDLFEDFINEKHLEILLDLPEKYELFANDFLVETLFQNLLSNAIKFAPNNSTIEISVLKNSLVVTNQGELKLNTEYLFDRFRSQSNHKVNSGLGLAIINEISNLNYWSIHYAFENKKHQFSVNFN